MRDVRTLLPTHPNIPGRSIMCDCKPGTYHDGWREVRSAECVEAELKALGLVITWALNHTQRTWQDALAGIRGTRKPR